MYNLTNGVFTNDNGYGVLLTGAPSGYQSTSLYLGSDTHCAPGIRFMYNNSSNNITTDLRGSDTNTVSFRYTTNGNSFTNMLTLANDTSVSNTLRYGATIGGRMNASSYVVSGTDTRAPTSTGLYIGLDSSTVASFSVNKGDGSGGFSFSTYNSNGTLSKNNLNLIANGIVQAPSYNVTTSLADFEPTAIMGLDANGNLVRNFMANQRFRVAEARLTAIENDLTINVPIKLNEIVSRIDNFNFFSSNVAYITPFVPAIPSTNTSAVTVSVTVPVATVSMQIYSSLPLDQAQDPNGAFQQGLIATIAANLGIPTSNVTITSVTSTVSQSMIGKFGAAGQTILVPVFKIVSKIDQSGAVSVDATTLASNLVTAITTPGSSFTSSLVATLTVVNENAGVPPPTVNTNASSIQTQVVSAPVSVAVPVSAVVASVPTNVIATIGSVARTATVSFIGDSTAYLFTVQSTPSSGTSFGARSPILVSGLTAGTSYTFTVSATNASGTSSYSVASNAVVPNAPVTVTPTPTPIVPTPTPVVPPTQLPSGYTLWMDASDTSTIVLSGGSVSQWTDKSSNGYTFTQSTSGNRPSYVTNATNGLNVMRFGGNSVKHFLGGGTSLPIGTNDVSMFAVCRFDASAPNGSCYLFAKSLYGPGDGRILYGLGAMGITAPDIASFSNYSSYSSYHIIEMVTNRSAGTTTIYSNGTQIYQATGLNTTTSCTTGYNMIIGGYNNGSGGINPPMDGLYMSGDICEMVMYASSTNTTTRQNIEGYLATKWGLQSTLPSTHLYAFIYPKTIPGCLLWLDAFDESSLVLNGSTISQWSDKSGNGNHITQSTSSLQPSVTNSTYPVVNTASGKWMSNTSFAFPAPPYSIFVVAANTNSSSGYQYLMKANSSGDYFLFFGASNGKFATFTGNNSVGWNDINANTPLTSIAQLSLIEMTNTGTSSGLQPYVNGTPLDTKSGIAGATTGIIIGATAAGFPLQAWNGNIGEILIYNSVVSTSQRQQIEGYLAWKWGLQSTLPSTHPNAPPIPTPVPQVTYVLTSNGFASNTKTLKYNQTSFNFAVPAAANGMFLKSLEYYGGGGNNGLNTTLAVPGASGQGWRFPAYGLNTITTSGNCSDAAGSYATPYSAVGAVRLSTGDNVTFYISTLGGSNYMYLGLNGSDVNYLGTNGYGISFRATFSNY